jgi:3-oxosteroid 1-dehydrogenase
MNQNSDWDMEADVVVIGSGAAGLSAALKAAVEGARVVVLEKAHVIGGTSAMSGGVTWAPANHHMLAAGHHDSPDEALDYIRAGAPDGWAEEEEPLWRAFVDTAPAMLKFVEDHSPVRFRLIDLPDLYPEETGGKDTGRLLTPQFLSLNILGDWRRRIRKSVRPHLFTYEELFQGPAAVVSHPARAIAAIWPRLLYRLATRRVSMGGALMGGLLKGCLDSGCEVLTDARAEALIADEDNGDRGRVIGLEATVGGDRRRIRAAKGIVLASGGYEWDRAMLDRHFPSEHVTLGSPDTNTGDGHRMAAALGARMAHMDQATIYPVASIMYEGRPQAFPVKVLDYAHCILVNRKGKRFLNEGDRNALTAALAGPTGADHLPAWRIFDRQFASKNRFAVRMSKWGAGEVLEAASISDLAKLINVDGDALEETITRFNGFVRAGRDEDFHRGETPLERFTLGDPRQPDSITTLGTIQRPPYFATRYTLGVLGTKGGPRTNDKGQVLREDDTVITGFYCAGTAMANFIGTKVYATGSTLGPFLTWGYICARSLLSENR